jgi:hypothetical protein
LRFAQELLPAVIFLSILSVYILILYLCRNCYRVKKRHSPVTGEFLRAPGQSLVEKIDSLNEDIGLYATLLITVPLVLYSSYVSQLYFYSHDIDAMVVNILAAIGGAITLYYLVKTLKLLRKRRDLRLGYDGETAVGQELNRLMLEGNYVYHDFPADNSNIDHIVVGRSGIFAVETQSRSKPSNKNRQEDATVEYDGKMLNFPDGDDFKVIEHAEQQASWLSEWISNAIGEEVAARAIVALPGWFVKRTSADGISVVNPKQFPSLFTHIKPRTLDNDTVARIAEELERKCRDSERMPAANESDQPVL